MSKEPNEKGKMYDMYGNYVPVPYSWYRLCRKYIIPKEVKVFTDKKENSIELNPMEINVLAYLANYDECYASNGNIAEVFQLKKQTIEKYMKELRWVGFIKTFETKDSPTHTSRRDTYVQHDAIKAVLESEDNPYIVPYECKAPDTCNIPSECNAGTLQTSCKYPTDVMQVYDVCEANKKEIKNIIKYNKEDAEDKSSAMASDEANQTLTIHDTSQIDLNIYKDITEKDVRNLQFNSQSHSDMFDDYEYVDCIYEQYIECCNRKRNANSTITSIKCSMKQYNCDEQAIETCIGYFLYQHRLLKRNVEEIKIDFTNDKLAS